MFAKNRHSPVFYQRNGQQAGHLFNAGRFFKKKSNRDDGRWDEEDVWDKRVTDELITIVL